MARDDRRVLHVLDKLTAASGVASVVMNYIRGIPQIRQDVAVYGYCDTAMEEAICACGGTVYRLPDISESFGMRFTKSVSQLLSENQYSIVHGHLMNSAFMYLREAKRLKVPHRIIHAHSVTASDVPAKEVRNRLLSLGIPLWANCYIAVSQEAARDVFGNLENRHAFVVHNGVDNSRFRFNTDIRREVRQELGLSNNTLCVGNVARFARLKNHSFLLDVFQIMRKRADCVLVLAGEGPLEDDIRSKARAMGLLDSIRFLGMRQDVERLYQAFDVFLLPSQSEGFGLVAVEAQCSGLACVFSDHVPQVVACNKHIEFLPLGDRGLWADTALALSKQCRVDGSSAVEAAKLNVDNMINKMSSIYESMRLENSF